MSDALASATISSIPTCTNNILTRLKHALSEQTPNCQLNSIQPATSQQAHLLASLNSGSNSPITEPDHDVETPLEVFDEKSTEFSQPISDILAFHSQFSNTPDAANISAQPDSYVGASPDEPSESIAHLTVSDDVVTNQPKNNNDDGDLNQNKTSFGSIYQMSRNFQPKPVIDEPLCNSDNVDDAGHIQWKAFAAAKGLCAWPLPQGSGFSSSTVPQYPSLLHAATVVPFTPTRSNRHRPFKSSFFIHPGGDLPPNDHARTLCEAGYLQRSTLVDIHNQGSKRWSQKESFFLLDSVVRYIKTESPEFHPNAAMLKSIVTKWSLDDWEKVAQIHGAKFSHRNGHIVCTRYMNFDAPWLKENSWTKEEDAVLIDPVKMFSALSSKVDVWSEAAQALGDIHSPLQCLRRWRHIQDEAVRKVARRTWEAAENVRLMQIRELLGKGSWESIALALGTLRSGQQCLHRYGKRLVCDHTIGKWSKLEVENLLHAVKNCGEGKWCDIARLVGTRNDVQCREKWVSGLNPNIFRGVWTKEEERRLRGAVQEFGFSNWKNVANVVGRRNGSQCQRRWAIMWTEKEDAHLSVIIEGHLSLDFKVVASQIGTRSERQCRNRATFLRGSE